MDLSLRNRLESVVGTRRLRSVFAATTGPPAWIAAALVLAAAMTTLLLMSRVHVAAVMTATVLLLLAAFATWMSRHHFVILLTDSEVLVLSAPRTAPNRPGQIIRRRPVSGVSYELDVAPTGAATVRIDGESYRVPARDVTKADGADQFLSRTEAPRFTLG